MNVSEVRVGEAWRRKSDGAAMRVLENPAEFDGRYSRIEIRGARFYVVRARIRARYELVERMQARINERWRIARVTAGIDDAQKTAEESK